MDERPTDGPHAARQAIERYVQGTLRREARQEFDRHLVGCVECQAAVAAAGDARRAVLWRGHRFAQPASAAPSGDPAAGRLRGVVRGLGMATDAFGASLLAELLQASEHERRALVSRDPRFASLPLAERLAASCRAAWLDDPEAAVEIARLAVAVAARLDPQHYGAAPVAGARALVWSQLGDSYRVAAAAAGHHREIAEGFAEEGEPGDYPMPRAAASSIGETAAYRDAAYLPAVLAALAETREICLARGAAFEAALVTVDLAAAYLRRGDAGAARALLVASPAILAATGLGGEGLARFEALATAATAGALDPDLLAAAGADLQRIRNDPAERFRDEP